MDEWENFYFTIPSVITFTHHPHMYEFDVKQNGKACGGEMFLPLTFYTNSDWWLSPPLNDIKLFKFRDVENHFYLLL